MNVTVVGALSRTYPTDVAGVTRSFVFDNAMAAFNLTFALGPPSAGTTDVFVSLEYHYPTGIRVAVFPPVLAWTWAPIVRGEPHPLPPPLAPAATT